ncbi:MAG TPA: hypothetical protein VK907_03180, partial [Phnomibacter sp.]|nr:hypothetical protein [Phnomibacter sp.]
MTHTRTKEKQPDRFSTLPTGVAGLSLPYFKWICALFLVFGSLEMAGQSFGEFGSAIYLSSCTNNNQPNTFYNTTGSGPNIINPSGPGFQGADLGSFPKNTGTLKLNGAEIKTWKNAGADVCAVKMFYAIYPAGNRPATPIFTEVDIPHFTDCSGTNFPDAGGGPCGDRDQKWQLPGDGSVADIDLTAASEVAAPGNYTIEIYFEI